MTNGYAVIADEASMASLLGLPSTSLVGVCVVEGKEARCHILEGRDGLDALVSGLPCSPSGSGSGTALPDFAAEMEALALIADEAASRFPADWPARSIFPEGFEPAAARMEGGLAARTTPYGLDLSVSLGLAAMLGWSEGDRLALGANRDGSLLAVARSGDGAILVQTHAAPGFLQIDRDLVGLPLSVGLGEGPWRNPEYQTRSGSLVFATASLLLQADAIQADSDRVSVARADAGVFSHEVPQPGRRCLRLAAAGLVAVSAAAGFMSAWLWL